MTHTKRKTIIGITGGIATGKSTLANILKELGYKVIDADKIANDLMKYNAVNYKKIVSFFGEDILKSNGEIDKKSLGKKVFEDEKLLKTLNLLTHQNIFLEIKKEIESSTDNIIFLDIPLLFETRKTIIEYDINIDEIWLVYSDRDRQIKRLKKRNNLTKDQAEKRIDAQLSIDLKKEMADRIIYNLGSIDDLKNNIKSLLKDIC